MSFLLSADFVSFVSFSSESRLHRIGSSKSLTLSKFTLRPRSGSIMAGRRHELNHGFPWALIAVATCLTSSSIELVGAQEIRCGIGFNNVSCLDGLCCSSWGHCGPTPLYCGVGCQPQSGPCKGTAPGGQGKCYGKFKLTCGTGQCCSSAGYCGTTRAHCGTGCLSGACWSAGKNFFSTILSVGPNVPSVPTAITALVVLLLVGRYQRPLRERLALIQQQPDAVEFVTASSGNDRHQMLTNTHNDDMRFSLSRLNKSTNAFSEELGRGAFGVVYKGTLEDGTEIAVKKLKKLLDREWEFEVFEAEVKTLKNINHGNLVALHGFCFEDDHSYLIYEYEKNGSLDMWIFGRNVSKGDFLLPWRTRMDIIRATAKGLVYLHKELHGGQKIVHLDIKPENILLDENFVPKIADFGMAKLVGSEKATHTIATGGTSAYMAPEAFMGLPCPEMDVYSFGVVLLEVLSGRRNLDLTLPRDRRYLPGWAIRKATVGQELKLIDPALDDVDEEEASRLVLTALLCLQRNFDKRPTISCALNMIRGIAMPSRPPPDLQSDLESTERLILNESKVNSGLSLNEVNSVLFPGASSVDGGQSRHDSNSTLFSSESSVNSGRLQSDSDFTPFDSSDRDGSFSYTP